jgi:acetyltransferase EpsM
MDTSLSTTRTGKNATIGAGSVVIDNIPDDVVVVGNPARIVKSKV